VPGWQVPPPQQPPWQIEWLASPHALSHWPVVVLQAVPMGQSPAPLQNGTSGAHRSFVVRGVNVPAPNWSSQKAPWVFFSALPGSGGRAGPRCLRLLRIGVSGVGPAVADRDAGPVPRLLEVAEARAAVPVLGEARRAAAAAVEDERAVRAAACVLALDHRHKLRGVLGLT